jgi:hypothetical protein
LGAVCSIFACRVCLGPACLGRVHLDIRGRGRPRRCPLLVALAAGAVDAKIVLRVLAEIFGSNSIVGDCGFAREGDVALEYLMGAAADLDVGAVAVECLIVLRTSRRLLEWPVAIIAPGWTLR